MPVLRLFGPKRCVEIRNLIQLLFQLYNESDLSRNAKVWYDVETDGLEKGISRDLLLIPSMHSQIISLNWSDLHDVPYVKRVDPLALVEETQDVPHV